MEVDYQRYAPAALPPGKRPGTHCIGGPQGRSGRMWKISPPPGFDPRTVQAVTSRYNDCVIAALSYKIMNLYVVTHARVNMWAFCMQSMNVRSLKYL
jgi:hypothetical protein